ncbi:hypothetical protein DEB26_09675, partial [Vibrio anguillarum]
AKARKAEQQTASFFPEPALAPAPTLSVHAELPVVAAAIARAKARKAEQQTAQAKNNHNSEENN